ncbi:MULTISPECIES: hypothetical protein [Methanobrevibacter]|uniref:hypothetical protein n=1 Tax=Methanobrevibacter TaxID=2172 RepID=UPI0026EA605D|nr:MULTISPECIES: hypothetical protein [Methanobrevibacter]MDY3097520.1 hypothetical protein [Methanobrevibacter sp.]
MERDKIIIIALIAIIAILLVSIIAIMPNIMKKDTQVTINSKSTLNEGDSIKIRLIDENGVAIANQNVNISINNGTVTDYHSITTDNQGIGKLELDKKAGSYDVCVIYSGNDNYKGCNATKMIKIEEVAEAEPTYTQSAPTAYAYQSDGTPMYSQSEVDRYMSHKYGPGTNYHIGSNGYVDMDEPGFDNAGNWIGY